MDFKEFRLRMERQEGAMPGAADGIWHITSANDSVTLCGKSADFDDIPFSEGWEHRDDICKQCSQSFRE
ncbi:hypothetical protein [Streptacidiphilus cavernicola]|uniref:Uncharacterized protein n=1 Tax=Streptacidiphilus cavernicola TaxID=3342716 RepID=A0ABV6VS17_9ACTN